MPSLDLLHQPYWTTMGPLLTLTVAAFVVMIIEFLFKSVDRRLLVLLSLAGVLAALGVAVKHFYVKPTIAANAVVADAFGSVFSVLILISAALVLLFTYDYSSRVRLAAEHSYLILFAVVGALAMATAVDLVTLYVGLELLSVSSYILAALRQRSVKSVEGGIKYLLMGSIGSAVLLYGMSFVYGIGGSTNLFELGSSTLVMFASYPAITVLAFILMLSGMGFKLSLVPFHMWTPDTYAGAPSPISAFLATLSKAASFGMLLRMLLFIFNGAGANVFWWAGVIAAVTMVIGNLIALPQRDMKRLLAFSSVAQAGYVLVPFALLGASDFHDWIALFDAISFYLFAYTFMTIGAFAIVHVVSSARGSGDSDSLVGLYHRSPWLGFALTVFLLGLAGMPLTGGFVGKFYIFADTLHLHRPWLGVLLFLTSVVSFFYYFGWIKKIFQRADDSATIAIRPTGVMSALVGLCVIGTLGLGLVPASLLHFLHNTQWLY